MAHLWTDFTKAVLALGGGFLGLFLFFALVGAEPWRAGPAILVPAIAIALLLTVHWVRVRQTLSHAGPHDPRVEALNRDRERRGF